MLVSEVVITLPGTAAPKGSLVCCRNKAHTLREDNKRTKPWRTKIATLARQASTPAGPNQPVGVEITVTILRPTSHYGTGRNRHQLRHSAPAFPSTRGSGDSDKYARTVLDALEDSGLVLNDAQVVEESCRKVYAAEEPPEGSDVLSYAGAVIRIYPIEPR